MLQFDQIWLKTKFTWQVNWHKVDYYHWTIQIKCYFNVLRAVIHVISNNESCNKWDGVQTAGVLRYKSLLFLLADRPVGVYIAVTSVWVYIIPYICCAAGFRVGVCGSSACGVALIPAYSFKIHLIQEGMLDYRSPPRTYTHTHSQRSSISPVSHHHINMFTHTHTYTVVDSCN